VTDPLPRHVAHYAAGREKIREFATATGETDPLCLDLDAARAAGYRDLVAPPMFVSVYAGPVFREALWSPELAVDRRLTVHGGQEFEWKAPVVAGDELTTIARAIGDEITGANRFIVIETSTTNQDRRPVSTGRWTVIVRPPPA
jgi:acyl dehydratase